MGKSVQEEESERVAALHGYHVLDTRREPVFDEIAAVAALLCNTPISAINFVDEVRQWTKAAVGVETLTMPAELSICAHAVQQKDVFVVPDIANDPRFSALLNLVAEPRPRFYAGVPLVTSEGHAIGTLCVLDVKPRELTENQSEVLRALARRAMTELELRSALEAERKARRQAERLLAEKESLLARNDVLMREIDHRVKNSLQIVAGMLGLQARRMAGSAAGQALKEAQQRIGAIASVHEQLYRASDADRVNMRVFLEGLCDALASNSPGEVDGLRVDAAPIVLTSQRATRIGLLVTELVTNSFKHAHPDGRRGDVEVTLIADGEAIRLIVRDEGVGLPPAFSIRDNGGLGMQLVRAVLNQIDGVMTIGAGPGAHFTIDIPPEAPAPEEAAPQPSRMSG